MRIALDPAPLVLGIYAYVGELLASACRRREERDARTLGLGVAGRSREEIDREITRRVRALHADVKTADKLLRKTADIWRISRETDFVELVVQPRGEQPEPQSYVLLQPDQIRGLLESVREAARAAGESEETLAQLERGAEALEARPGQYLAFGFDLWGA
ncbi:MAG TPA: hypothetical protein VIL13_08610 [Longimicrobiales bacterium]